MAEDVAAITARARSVTDASEQHGLQRQGYTSYHMLLLPVHAGTMLVTSPASPFLQPSPCPRWRWAS